MKQILLAAVLIWFAFRVIRGSLYVGAILAVAAAVLFILGTRSFSLARTSRKELH